MKKTLEQIEAERLSRRQALSRLGFLAGASAVAALTSDELLRKVGAELRERSEDNLVVNSVAKEFQSAGVALADNQLGTVPQHSGNLACTSLDQIQFCAAVNECRKNWCWQHHSHGTGPGDPEWEKGCKYEGTPILLCDYLTYCYSNLNSCIAAASASYPGCDINLCTAVSCDDCA